MAEAMPGEALPALRKIPSGVPGFDFVARGGLPAGRATLIAGSSGSGKTVFGCQFLAAGIGDLGESGVFVTFEEQPEGIRRNVAGFGWTVADWEAENRWAFVNAAPDLGVATVEAGPFDLEALLLRIVDAVDRVGATRVVLDSLGTVFARFEDQRAIRLELQRIIAALGEAGLTSVITCERHAEYGRVAEFGVEEFVADSVVVLRNVLTGEKRRRSAEILKMRGTAHHVGEVPMSIHAGTGLRVIPLGAIELDQPVSGERRSCGNTEVDRLCGGGWFADAVSVVSGASGCGKTLLATEFVGRPAQAGERCLMFAFEESAAQIVRNAAALGLELQPSIDGDRLRIVSAYPETATLEEHLARIRELLAEFRPERVALDSLSALGRLTTNELQFRQFLVGLTAAMKEARIMCLYTSATEGLTGSNAAAGAQISTLADTILLMRYVESGAVVRRALNVLKMRGSGHDRGVHEFTLDERGLRVGKSFTGNTGILSSGGVPGAPDATGR